MHPIKEATVPLNSDVQGVIETVMLVQADHTATVFYWDSVPVEHTQMLARHLADIYDIILDAKDLHGLTVIEICACVQRHVMERLDPRPRHDDVFKVLCDLLDQRVDIQAEHVRYEHLLADDLCVDSASKIQVVADIEDTYLIRISDKEFDQLRTIGDIIAFVITRAKKPLAA